MQSISGKSQHGGAEAHVPQPPEVRDEELNNKSINDLRELSKMSKGRYQQLQKKAMAEMSSDEDDLKMSQSQLQQNQNAELNEFIKVEAESHSGRVGQDFDMAKIEQIKKIKSRVYGIQEQLMQSQPVQGSLAFETGGKGQQVLHSEREQQFLSALPPSARHQSSVGQESAANMSV